jgi:hypothetical protein
MKLMSIVEGLDAGGWTPFVGPAQVAWKMATVLILGCAPAEFAFPASTGCKMGTRRTLIVEGADAPDVRAF